MERVSLRAAGACVGLLAAGAAAADVVIDTEHRAAGGFYTALRLLDEVPANYAILAYGSRDYTDRMLRLLNAAWTPAALAAQPAGADVACPGGGAFHASYSKRVLDLSLTACALDIYGWTHTLNGPIQVKLKSDTFAPVTVAALNLGSASADFLEDTRITGSSGPGGVHVVRNQRMSGNIQLGRATVDDNFEGTYSHAISGFYHEFNTFQIASPEAPWVTSEFRVDADPGASVSGSFSYGDLSWKEDVTLTGNFRQSGIDGTSGTHVESVIAGATALRALKSGNYETGTERYLVSGAAHYSWPAGSGRECHSGDYSFATPAQLTHPDWMQSDAWSAGSFSINNAATFTFSRNPSNSPLGDMHVHLVIANVGVFDDDGDSLGSTTFATSAACPD